MTQQKKQWGAIIIMIALFAMIAHHCEEPIWGFGYFGAGR